MEGALTAGLFVTILSKVLGCVDVLVKSMFS